MNSVSSSCSKTPDVAAVDIVAFQPVLDAFVVVVERNTADSTHTAATAPPLVPVAAAAATVADVAVLASKSTAAGASRSLVAAAQLRASAVLAPRSGSEAARTAADNAQGKQMTLLLCCGSVSEQDLRGMGKLTATKKVELVGVQQAEAEEMGFVRAWAKSAWFWTSRVKGYRYLCCSFATARVLKRAAQEGRRRLLATLAHACDDDETKRTWKRRQKTTNMTTLKMSKIAQLEQAVAHASSWRATFHAA